MGVPGLGVTGPGILDLGGVLTEDWGLRTEDGGLRGRGIRGRALETGLGELTGGLGTLLGRGPKLGPGLGYGGNIFGLIKRSLLGPLKCITRRSAEKEASIKVEHIHKNETQITKIRVIASNTEENR